jgi:hypothetical protein
LGQGGAAGTGARDASSTDGPRSDGAGTAGSNRGDGEAPRDGAPGDAGDFQPCPTNGDPCKILPFGDSITFGTSSPMDLPGGYRIELFTKAVMAGQKITFVGSQMNGPTMVLGMTFPRNHEGHPGFTIPQITADNVFNPAFMTLPDIVLLHIGTNDANAATAPATISDRLSMLLDKITTRAPNALVVVAQIIPLGNARNQMVTGYNSMIPGVVQMKTSQGKHVVVVDMNTGFNMLSPDGIHPDQAGYNTMGDRWYSVISTYLPK